MAACILVCLLTDIITYDKDLELEAKRWIALTARTPQELPALATVAPRMLPKSFEFLGLFSGWRQDKGCRKGGGESGVVTGPRTVKL